MEVLEIIQGNINQQLIELNFNLNGVYRFKDTTSRYNADDNSFIRETSLISRKKDYLKTFRITTDYTDMADWALGFRIGIQDMDDKTAKIKNHCDYLIKYKLLGDNKFYLDYHEEHLADHFLNWLDPSHKIASIKE